MTQHTVHNLVQGTEEWHKHRASHFNASDAAAMLGIDKKRSRNDLLRTMATGDEKEFPDWAQANLLGKGHEAEAAARPKAEEIIGEDLYPIVASRNYLELPLSASYDGVTMDEARTWEHKLLNAELHEALRDGMRIPEQYKPQLEQQLLILDADQCLFMTSNGGEVMTAWYESDPNLRNRLIAGWKQFAEDIKNYTHVEVLPAPTGKSVVALPALDVKLVGDVQSSNVVVYQAAVSDFIASINTELKTDQDFADAEKNLKFCADKEIEIAAVKRMALAQTGTIDEIFAALDTVSGELRSKRLELDKLIKARKATIRAEIVGTGTKAIQEHIAKLNESIGYANVMPLIDCDFAGAVKNKRTIDSLRNAVDTELANAKIKANDIAYVIQGNINTLRGVPEDKIFLFPDAARAPVVLKDKDDYDAMIKMRLAEHKEAEDKRLEAERERIRQEEVDKIAAEKKREAVAVDLAVQAGAVPDIDECAAQSPVKSISRTLKDPTAKPRMPSPGTHSIIATLAGSFGTDSDTVVGWLIDLDITGLRAA